MKRGGAAGTSAAHDRCARPAFPLALVWRVEPGMHRGPGRLAGGNGGHTVLGASSDTTRSTPRKTRIEREAFRDPVGDQVPTRKMTLKCSFSGVISIDPKRFLDTGALNLNVEGHQVVGGQERLAECHDPHSVLLDGLSCDLGVQAHQAMPTGCATRY